MLLLRGVGRCGGIFLFFFLSFNFPIWLCASWISLCHLVGADAGCNSYLRDINIFPFLKKRQDVHGGGGSKYGCLGWAKR